MFKKSMVVMALLSVSTMAVISSGAHADGFGGGFHAEIGGSDALVAAKVENLEKLVGELQNRVQNLNERISRLEQFAQPQAPVGWTCSTNDNFSRPYIGHGATQIDAQFDARNSCTKGSGAAMFCNNPVSCSQ